MSSTIPYIGSKISLISNSEIRYEGILYTINTQESTIALQSVKTFGTEGRKIPEIPPSSEIYDFIIFRGQDIKDLTVLEGAQGQSSPQLNDPAIMSMNQRPSGGPGKDGPKGGGKAPQSKGAASHEKGSGGGGWSMPQPQKGGGREMSAWGGGGGWDSGKGDGWGKGGKSDSWGKGGGGGKGDGWGKGGGKGDGWGKGGGKGDGWSKGGGGGGKGWDRWDDGSKGKSAYPKGGGKGKGDGKGSAPKGKAKGDGGKGGKGERGGNRFRGGAGAPNSGVPVGELLPETNADAKKEFAEEFDFEASNTKFDKSAIDDTEQKKAPLSGYSKTSSFFDNISCEATDRAAESDRPKIDREKARQYDKDTFGDTRRPPRLVGVRRGKGKGGGKWN